MEQAKDTNALDPSVVWLSLSITFKFAITFLLLQSSCCAPSSRDLTMISRAISSNVILYFQSIYDWNSTSNSSPQYQPNVIDTYTKHNFTCSSKLSRQYLPKSHHRPIGPSPQFPTYLMQRDDEIPISSLAHQPQAKQNSIMALRVSKVTGFIHLTGIRTRLCSENWVELEGSSRWHHLFSLSGYYYNV